ncbi:MAG: hypothetical protein AAF667_17870 [Pseudomonadota bacterium]
MAKSGKSRRRFGRGGILTVGLILLTSATLRVGSGPGQAVANEFVDMGAASRYIADADEACTDPEHIRALLRDLGARETRVAEVEALLADREQAINVAEIQARQRLEELFQAEEALSATMSLAKSAAENDLAQLTSVYENMKPKEAIPLFEAMDPEFSAGFLARMRSDLAAAIMAGLAPETAYSISVILAGRNADVPTR